MILKEEVKLNENRLKQINKIKEQEELANLTNKNKYNISNNIEILFI